MKAINQYWLPIPRKDLKKIDQTSSPMHVGTLRNAIDFVAGVGTPVLAAADGIVTWVKDSSYTGGPSLEYWLDSNFIVIKHPRGEHSRYDHLAHKSAMVGIGQSVKTGEIIGRVGLTGFTYLPHLHFQVFVLTGSNPWMDFDTRSVDFE